MPPSVSRSERSTAWTVSPFVSPLLIRSVRRTEVSSVVAGARRLDRADAPDHPERVVGEGGVVAHERLAGGDGEHVGAQPVQDGQEHARPLSEIARTATIAAIPMAMPTAVSEDRSRREQAAPGDPRDPDRPGPRGSGMDPPRDRPPASPTAVTPAPAAQCAVRRRRSRRR